MERKMEATRWLSALFFLILLFVGIYFYSRSVKIIATLGLPVALVVFLAIFHWVNTMGNKADSYSERAFHVRRGALAGEDIGNLLSGLPAGYYVVHDFICKTGNIDHIVISRKGILTIETKSHRGVVGCEGETLKLYGEPFEKDFIKQALAQAFSIRDLLAGHGITAPKLQPVILFDHADVQVRNQVRGVEIVGRRYLSVFLERLQTRMTAKEAEKIFEILKLSQSRLFV